MELTHQAFSAIASRIIGRAGDIRLFTESGYSFEEWLNWEAFAACRQQPGWEVFARPSYAKLGLSGCRDFGDLLVRHEEQATLVEVGLVHDYTSDKWLAKLDWDTAKLERCGPMACSAFR